MNTMNQLRDCLKGFEFEKAFREVLEWNRTQRAPFEKTVAGRTLQFKPLAEIGGFTALEVTETSPLPEGATHLTSPQSVNVRRMADTLMAAEIEPHILIFKNNKPKESVWQFSSAKLGKRLVRERRYYPGAPVQPLTTLLTGFHIPYNLLDASGEVPHTAMLDRADKSGAFAEKVSKKFYDLLKKRRDAFDPFLGWIENEQKRSWYLTALLNRLMFVYFVQKKGLLGGDQYFISNRLQERMSDKNRFYHDYFLPLCFLGFGREQGSRGRFESLFEAIPYLNGGLFAVHPVEKEFGVTPEAVLNGSLSEKLTIPDSEFQKWFAFFDAWRWTFDETDIQNEGQINPSILGFIFEKYINQKQMGAYYTKEDITGYIGKNTLLPRLFDMLAATGDKGAKAVHPLPIGPHPNLMNNGKGMSEGEGIDRYVYPAVKTMDNLPTETEREFDARQKRYGEILSDFGEGKIATVNDFITYNLDIEKMTLDFINVIQDAEVLRNFYFNCLQRLTVLDPTCGSGAFLFAALKILSPLYEACLKKMAALDGAFSAETVPIRTMVGEFAFVNEIDDQQNLLDLQTVTPVVRNDFKAELERIETHPNREYYIYKTIIVNNLFGVDIMDEAVEICKLRLFLKLIAHAESDPAKKNFGIEPLPDIDFNVLAGNTLVGYTGFDDMTRQWKNVGRLELYERDPNLQMLINEYSELLQDFQRQQLGEPVRRAVAKSDLERSHELVQPLLDKDLLALYVTAGKVPPKTTQKQFIASHQPFHWFVEFPQVMASGGFDCIIGNPPYVEYSKVKKNYQIVGYETEGCGNLFAFIYERTLKTLNVKARSGLIVPISSISTPRMESLMLHISSQCQSLYTSNFAVRPAKLFEGVDMNLTIHISQKRSVEDKNTYFSTSYTRWYSDARAILFESLHYLTSEFLTEMCTITKISKSIEKCIWEKLLLQKKLSHLLLSPFTETIYVHSGGRYFRKCVLEQLSTEYKPLLVPQNESLAIIALLSSNLFYWFWLITSDTYHVTKKDVEEFRSPDSILGNNDLKLLGKKLLIDIWKNSIRLDRHRKDGTSQLEINFKIGRSKPIIDEIDRVLAKHYGFTEEELDFIINYDIKYRMGKGAAEEE